MTSKSIRCSQLRALLVSSAAIGSFAGAPVARAQDAPKSGAEADSEVITVTAQRDKPDASSTRIAGIAATTKKN